MNLFTSGSFDLLYHYWHGCCVKNCLVCAELDDIILHGYAMLITALCSQLDTFLDGSNAASLCAGTMSLGKSREVLKTVHFVHGSEEEKVEICKQRHVKFYQTRGVEKVAHALPDWTHPYTPFLTTMPPFQHLEIVRRHAMKKKKRTSSERNCCSPTEQAGLFLVLLCMHLSSKLIFPSCVVRNLWFSTIRDLLPAVLRLLQEEKEWTGPTSYRRAGEQSTFRTSTMFSPTE